MGPAAEPATEAVPEIAGPAPMAVAQTVLDWYSRAVAGSSLAPVPRAVVWQGPGTRVVAYLCPEPRAVACFEMRWEVVDDPRGVAGGVPMMTALQPGAGQTSATGWALLQVAD